MHAVHETSPTVTDLHSALVLAWVVIKVHVLQGGIWNFTTIVDEQVCMFQLSPWSVIGFRLSVWSVHLPYRQCDLHAREVLQIASETTVVEVGSSQHPIFRRSIMDGSIHHVRLFHHDYCISFIRCSRGRLAVLFARRKVFLQREQIVPRSKASLGYRSRHWWVTVL